MSVLNEAVGVACSRVSFGVQVTVPPSLGKPHGPILPTKPNAVLAQAVKFIEGWPLLLGHAFLEVSEAYA